MKSPALRWSAVGLLILIAVIHLYMAPSEYEEAPLLGYLFVANFLAAVAAAVGIRRQAAWGWVLGFWAAGGAIAGYIATRTVGMPGMEPEAWLYPVGVVSTLVEMAFVVLFVLARPWAIERSQAEPAEGTAHGRLVAPAALAFVAVFGLAGFLWGVLGPSEERHLAAQVAHATRVSDSALLEEYGVQVVQVAPSMMNSIVDFRFRVVDKTKAQALLSDHEMMPILVVDDGKTVLTPPNQHMHQQKLKNGASYYAFYPNLKQAVKSGTSVAVQFGDLRLPPTTVQ
jgi:hypothetical protein